jgi:hypothetical protein
LSHFSKKSGENASNYPNIIDPLEQGWPTKNDMMAKIRKNYLVNHLVPETVINRINHPKTEPYLPPSPESFSMSRILIYSEKSH